MPHIKLTLEGLSCASCVARAETAIRGVDGVKEATVNLASETAQIDYEGVDTTASIKAALETAGYPAREFRTALSVENMSCASCVSRVEKIALEQPGVTTAQANLASEIVEITSINADIDGVARALTASGYRATRRDLGDDDLYARQQHEISALFLRFLFAAVLTVPVFVIEMGGHLIPALHHFASAILPWTVQFVLASIVLFVPGRHFFKTGGRALLKGAPEMNSLVALGAGSAWAYSTVATFVPGLLPESARVVYFEAAMVIVTLILLGRYIEARAKGKTGEAVRALVGLKPDLVLKVTDDGPKEIALGDLVRGDVVMVRPGTRIPVDGIVLEGRSFVDESMISGEPEPVAKSTDAAVIGGTMNGAGALTVRATAVGSETVLARIIDMVERAQGSKIPVQQLIDKVTGVFVPVVIGIALLTGLVWFFLGPSVEFAVVAAVSVLIIACPCAMGLATPTSIMVGMGRGAEMGILFRNGAALQKLPDVKTVAFDKTGTLTEGVPSLKSVHSDDKDDMLRLAASLEQYSEHPIARAIIAGAQERNLHLLPVSDFESLTGLGARATVGQRQVMIGSPKFFAQEGIDTIQYEARASVAALNGETILFVAVENKLAGLISVADQVKTGALDTVSGLKAKGINVALISGDSKATANAIASKLTIDTVIAEVMPEGKVEAVAKLKEKGAVAFCGDGINDAPALAEADIGVAVANGTDVAIETADVVLMSEDIKRLVSSISLSKAVMQNIKQNLFWAFAYNVLLIPVAAGVFYPLTGLMLSPALGAGAMAFSSVFVVTNALRLRKFGTEER